MAQFKPGMEVVAGQRSEDGERWALINEQGQTIQLTHDQADAIFVKLIETGSSDS